MISLFITLIISAQTFAADFKFIEKGPTQNFIFERDPKALITTIQLVFRAGSIHNPSGKSGLAQFAFGSLLRGTKDKSRQDYISALEQLGASIGIDSGTNRTIISLDAINENLPAAVSLLFEALFEPAFREEEMKSFKDEVLGLLKQESANNRAILKRMIGQTLYQNTPAAIPPNGIPKDVSSISVDDVKSFLSNSLYQENLVIAVASNKDEKEIKSLLAPSLAKIAKGKKILDVKISPIPPKGRVVYLVDRKGSSTTEVAIIESSAPANFPENYQLETGLFIFGTEFNSRLSTVLRKENGWTYGAYAFYHLYDLPRKFGGNFTLWTFPQKEHTEKAVLKALEMYEDYVKNGVTQKELSYAKQSLKNSYPFKLAGARNRLNQRIYSINDGAPYRGLEEYRAKIESVTRASILRTVRKIHDPNNLFIILVGDLEITRPLANKIPQLNQLKIVSDPLSFP